MGESERFWSILRLLFDVRRVERRVAVGLLIGTLCIVLLRRSLFGREFGAERAPRQPGDWWASGPGNGGSKEPKEVLVGAVETPNGRRFAANCEAPSF